MTIWILTFIAIVVVVVGGLWLMKYSDEHLEDWDIFGIIVGFITVVVGLLLAVLYACNIWGWVASDYQAKIINREYGTNYTAQEVFFADNVIDKIQEIKRKRVEINGNVMQNQPNKEQK